jgi:hypothetical protein
MTQLTEHKSRTDIAKHAISGCGQTAAAQISAFLVGGYPSLQIHDAKAFTRHLIDLLADYPADLCQQAAKEIPRKERFLNVAAVGEWLEERMHERRAEYARAVERQRKAEADAAEAEHRAQVERDRLAFKEWEQDHPGGTLKQYLGFEPYRAPSEAVEDDIKPCEMGPYTLGAIARRMVGEGA